MSLPSVLPSTDKIIYFKRVDISGLDNLFIFCNPFISDFIFLSSLPDSNLNSITAFVEGQVNSNLFTPGSTIASSFKYVDSKVDKSTVTSSSSYLKV